ncbi:hypothetical protein MKW92_008160 [Papaver armeniacum]|nr:hypothetical protein MKW92_008160 [Papaver armeniacum]
MASGLHKHGICKGDVVLILLPNTLFFPIVFLSVLSIGDVATTMNPLSSLCEIKKQISTCNVVLAFTLYDKMTELENLGLGVVVVPLDFESLRVPAYSFSNKLLSSDSSLSPSPRIDWDDNAAKGVMSSHRNLISVVEIFVRFEALQYESRLCSSKNVYLAAIPMFHVYGLSLFVMRLFSLGFSIVVTRKFDLNEMNTKSYELPRCTVMVVVPLDFESLRVPTYSFSNKLLSSDSSLSPSPRIDWDDTAACRSTVINKNGSLGSIVVGGDGIMFSRELYLQFMDNYISFLFSQSRHCPFYLLSSPSKRVQK